MGRGGAGIARRRAAFQPKATCERCSGADPESPCICEVQDRCSSTHDRSGQQCILGAGHSLKHVTATGTYF